MHRKPGLTSGVGGKVLVTWNFGLLNGSHATTILGLLYYRMKSGEKRGLL